MLCGLAPSQGFLIGARFLQGFGAAMQASVILAIIVTEFPEPADRAKAMSAYVFVAVAGGSLGLLDRRRADPGAQLALDLLRQPADRHRHFRRRPGADPREGTRLGTRRRRRLARLGARHRRPDERRLRDRPGHKSRLGLGSGARLRSPRRRAAGRVPDARVAIANPIMPLRILRLRGLIGSSAVRGFLVTGMYSTFFLGTLYLEHVLHYSALETGLAFLPWTMTVGILSLGVTARLVSRFGRCAC
jgi:MFS family permease